MKRADEGISEAGQAPTEQRGAFSWRGRLAVLQNADLRLVWLAQVVSQLGDGMFTVGIVWLVVQRTGSGTALSGTLIAQLLPFALFGPVAGALADRWNRRLTMVGSDIVRGVLVGLLPLLDSFGLLHMWMVPVIAFTITVGGQFFDPAKNAFVPAITPRHQLLSVNALLSGTRQVLFIAGPAVGGALIGIGGVDAVFWADAVSFFLSAVILLRLRSAGHEQIPSRAQAPSDPPATANAAGQAETAVRESHLWEDIREGLRYVWRVPVLRLVVLTGTVVNFLLSPLPVIIPLFFNHLGLPPAAFGTALSVILGGFLVGVAYMGLRGNHQPMGPLIIGATIVAGCCSLIIGSGPHLSLILSIGLVGGASIGAMEVIETTILQRESTDELRGRVFSLYESVSQGGRAISVAFAGVLADLVSERVIFYVVGICTILCGMALATNSAVRRLR